jgi:hypothetical protein
MTEKRGAKRAQVSLFVILGIILLLIVFVVIFLLTRKTQKVSETEAVPLEFKPVSNFVENCIHQKTIEAIKKMGAHGGYIDPTNPYLTPNAMKYLPSDATSSELVSISGDPNALVPYYLYVKGSSNYNNHAFASLAPSIENMQTQIKGYILSELPVCVGEFSEMKAQGFDVQSDPFTISPKVLIRNSTVEVYVSYPLNLTKGGLKTDLSLFKTVIRFPFMKYYDLATTVAGVELSTQFSEGFTSYLIQYYSGADPNMLPPKIAYTDAPYVITWSNTKVKNDLNSLLVSYVPTLQVAGTRDAVPINVTGDDVDAMFYKSLSMQIFNETLPNTSITFFYRSNTLKTKVQPSKGDLIKPGINVRKGSNDIPEDRINA